MAQRVHILGMQAHANTQTQTCPHRVDGSDLFIHSFLDWTSP